MSFWTIKNIHSVEIGNEVFFTFYFHRFSGKNFLKSFKSKLCHNSKIGSHCFIAAQSLVGGRAEIGLRTFVGFNSTILQDVCVGDDCLVGAKSLVTNNIPGASKCFGTPAKVVSTHESIGVTVP